MVTGNLTSSGATNDGSTLLKSMWTGDVGSCASHWNTPPENSLPSPKGHISMGLFIMKAMATGPTGTRTAYRALYAQLRHAKSDMARGADMSGTKVVR